MTRNRITLAIAICIYVVLVVFEIYRGLGACEGKFVYPLDDPYIHLTIAHNLISHGTWGLNPGEFASGSSSLFYTLLLAGVIFLSSASEYLPLIINILAGIGVLVSINAVLKRFEIDDVMIGLILLASIFLIPLVSLTISGMEHTLQILINTWYFYFCLKYLSKQDYKWDIELFWLCVFSTLVVMTRFEGMFFVVIPTVYFFFWRHYAKAFVIVFATFLPVIVFGAISILHGSYFLPNSIMIKAERPEQFSLSGLLSYSVVWLNKMYIASHLMGLFVILVACFILLNVLNRNYKSIAHISCFSYIVLLLIHLQFAKTGWFFRYESYLISLSFIAFGLIYQQVKGSLAPYRVYLLIASCVLMIPMARRGFSSLKTTPTAMQNIHDQQYQMAQFIKAFYPSSTIAANDIGAITFFNDIHLVDLYGLGNIEVLRLKEKGLFNKEAVQELARKNGVKIAIIYDHWFVGSLPVNWTSVEKWVIQNNVVCAFNDVSFYAIDPSEANDLRRNLGAFHRELPQRVTILDTGGIN